MMKPALRNALLCVLFLLARPALALDGFGVITGVVLDGQTWEVKAGVAVTAWSRSLMGDQTVITDENGFYRLPQLPPGVYSLRFDHDSFEAYTIPTIVVRLNQTYRMNVRLINESIHYPTEPCYRSASAPWPEWLTSK